MKTILALLLLLACGCQHTPPASKPPPPLEPPRAAAHDEPLSIKVKFPDSIRATPATGRLLLFLSKKEGEPRRNIDWFNFAPVYAIDVTNLAPNVTVEFAPAIFRHPAALAYPKPLGDLPPGDYRVQALLDLDNTERDWNSGPGNLYSSATNLTLNGRSGGAHSLRLENIIGPLRPPATNEWVDYFEIRSEMLSAFYQREVFLRAGVVLPPGYATSTERYPVIYQIPGFSGRHTGAWNFINGPRGRAWKSGEDPVPALMVVLDPDLPLGHSVFANSDNNGPVGDALVQEFIPALEKRYRAISDPRARVVTGHSSGGWSSLWLQIAYPDFFGGCWSTAPDPVDFRFFQTVNIYEDLNGHWSPDGHPRALARNQHEVLQTFTRFNHWEYVVGLGGQLDSFNAVFSRRAPDGRPAELMNKLSGEIDRSVAESWKRYDIRLILQENWSTLGPKLRGKIHVIAAAWDNYYLDPATRALAAFLHTTGHGGYVQHVPGDHGTMMTDEVRKRIRAEIAQHFKSGLEALK